MLSVAAINTMAKSNSGRRKFISAYTSRFSGHHWGRQDRNARQEL